MSDDRPMIPGPDGDLTHGEWRERVQDYINAGDRGREAPIPSLRRWLHSREHQVPLPP